MREAFLNAFGLFGDDVDLERARDMNERLLKVQLLQIAVLTAMMLGGIVAYNPLAAIPIVLSELGFLISLLFPLDFARAQLPLMGGWFIGQSFVFLALLVLLATRLARLGGSPAARRLLSAAGGVLFVALALRLLKERPALA